MKPQSMGLGQPPVQVFIFHQLCETMADAFLITQYHDSAIHSTKVGEMLELCAQREVARSQIICPEILYNPKDARSILIL
jgi:hypothetical protein